MAVCENCRRTYEQMNRGLELPVVPDLNQENTEALKTVKQTLRWKAAAVAAISVLLTLILVISGYMVFENVGVVHDFFDPSQFVVVRERQTGDWQPLLSLNTARDAESGTTPENILCFDNIFYSRKVVNNAQNNEPVSLRFRDMDGNIVLDILDLQPGTSASLHDLDLFKDYYVEIRTDADRMILNFY